MKFIRDIIAERSDTKASKPSEAPADFEVEPDPKPRTPRPDRTMTRLSDGAMLGADDVFKRLLSENGTVDTDQTELTDTALFSDDASEQDSDPVEADEDSNLFEDLASDLMETTDEAEAEDEAPNITDPIEDILSDTQSEIEVEPTPELEPETQAEDEPTTESEVQAEDAFSTSMPPVPTFVATPRKEPEPPTPAVDAPSIPDMVAVPAPASGRAGRGAGRVKTRFLGFGAPETPVHDPFAHGDQSDAPAAAQTTFPVGWLVVTAGPGRGTSFALHDGVSQIGRGDDQAIRLDFGDTSISRTNHAAIAYDSEQSSFYLGHGGKANMVRLNDRPVLSTEEISSGAVIRIGETTLRFVAFCDGDFSWAEEGL